MNTMTQNQWSNMIIASLLLGTSLLHAQCNSWEAHPKGVQLAKEQHQVYRDLFRSNQFKEAFPIWYALFQHVQVPQEVPSRHFKDGIRFYKEQAKVEKDSMAKAAKIDTIILLYNQLAECLGEEMLDRTWEGYDIYALSSSVQNYERAMVYFEKAMGLGHEKTSEIVLVPMAQIAIYLFQQKRPKFTSDYLTKLYNNLQKVADYHLKDSSKLHEIQKKWNTVHELFYAIKDSLPQIWGCTYYEKTCKNNYELDSNNIEKNKSVLNLLLKYCSDSSALYQQILKRQKYLLLNMFEGKFIDELPLLKQGTCRENQAQNFLKEGDTIQSNQYQKMAWELFEKAVKIEHNDSLVTKEEQAKLCYKLAYKSYQEGDFEKARSYCRQALKWNAAWGEPYLLIGTMYASSSKRCGKDDDKGWTTKTILWVAIDEWEKAKQVDATVKEQAEANIKRYQPYLPTRAEAFTHSLTEGNSYKVNCWIQQATTVQLLKE